uniref:Uncharacterized protein n=1 Tax=Avena sativa TaxID=4498 RepID=A0ACD6AE44_AVESA
MRGSSLTYAMIILSLVVLFLAATFECRLEDGGRSDHTNVDTRANAVNSTIDQTKLSLKFCTGNICDHFHECFCCQTLPGVPCFPKMEDCRAKCPLCNPNCHLNRKLI